MTRVDPVIQAEARSLWAGGCSGPEIRSRLGIDPALLAEALGGTSAKRRYRRGDRRQRERLAARYVESTDFEYLWLRTLLLRAIEEDFQDGEIDWRHLSVLFRTFLPHMAKAMVHRQGSPSGPDHDAALRAAREKLLSDLRFARGCARAARYRRHVA